MNDLTAPVTQHELTQTEIDYSVKVSKQVIISKLKEEIRDLSQLVKDQQASNKERFVGKSSTGTIENDLLVVMKKRLALVLNNDTALNHLRLAINSMTDNDVRKNSSLLQSDDLYQMRLYEYSSKGLEKFLASQMYNCTYHIVSFLPSREELRDAKDNSYSDSVDNLMRFEIELPLPGDVLEKIRESLEVTKIMEGNEAKLRLLNNKLKNIDTAMEELEAKLLVNHMAKSDHGKEALKVASSIVSEMLGSDVPLLADFKE